MSKTNVLDVREDQMVLVITRDEINPTAGKLKVVVPKLTDLDEVHEAILGYMVGRYCVDEKDSYIFYPSPSQKKNWKFVLFKKDEPEGMIRNIRCSA